MYPDLVKRTHRVWAFPVFCHTRPYGSDPAAQLGQMRGVYIDHICESICFL